METRKIRSKDFYNEYHGHPVADLQRLLPELRQQAESLIWTAGDSSLDNKYWFPDLVAAPPGTSYERMLDPPTSKPDVNFWLNHLLALEEKSNNNQKEVANKVNSRPRQQGQEKKLKWAAINTAVEATTLNERTFRLRPQDEFLRDNIRADDVLVVSVGGNDVALIPSPCTIINMACLMHCLPQVCTEHGFTCGTMPCDDCCWGCGPSSCGSFCCACPPCLGYFRHMFGMRTKHYIDKLTAKTKPAFVLVCMIYYPDETVDPRSWAGPALRLLGYDRNPGKLQAFVRKLLAEASSTIKIDGTKVVPVALFEALDSKNTDDYVARVEPSATGGRKIAELILDHIVRSSAGGMTTNYSNTSSGAPLYQSMQERS